MIYVMSDLHGCYDKYKKMLDKLELCKDDKLYILGDVLDRGDDSIGILRDMMWNPHIVPLIGNHEYMAYRVLEKLNVEITEDNYATQLDAATISQWENWMANGGFSTQQQFSSLNHMKRKLMLDYIAGFEAYEEIEVNGVRYVLVHAGLGNFSESRELSDYTLNELVWTRCDYNRVYFKDKILVTGHTPTQLIDENGDCRIYKSNNHIAVDCGAVFGGRLGCICLDTMEEFYV